MRKLSGHVWCQNVFIIGWHNISGVSVWKENFRPTTDTTHRKSLDFMTLWLVTTLFLACIVDKDSLTSVPLILRALHVFWRMNVLSDCVSTGTIIKHFLILPVLPRDNATEWIASAAPCLLSDFCKTALLLPSTGYESVSLFMSPCNEVGWNFAQTLLFFWCLHLLEIWSLCKHAKQRPLFLMNVFLSIRDLARKALQSSWSWDFLHNSQSS